MIVSEGAEGRLDGQVSHLPPPPPLDPTVTELYCPTSSRIKRLPPPRSIQYCSPFVRVDTEHRDCRVRPRRRPQHPEQFPHRSQRTVTDARDARALFEESLALMARPPVVLTPAICTRQTSPTGAPPPPGLFSLWYRIFPQTPPRMCTDLIKLLGD